MIEAYKVGILIALNNKASYALGIIARDFARTDAAAQRLKKTIKDVSLLSIGGGGLMGAGLLGLKAAGTWMDAATKYEQAFARFRALNLGDGVNRQADRMAQGARLAGVTATELMTTMTDLHTVFGHFEHAKNLAPMVARMEFANRAIYGDATKFNTAQALNMGKVVEMRGGFHSEAEMKRQIDYMQHVMAGTGGRVMPSDYLNFIKTAGVAGRLQNNQNFYYQMEPLIQEMGGNRVGTALMSAYQNLAQGRTTVRAARELMRLGLVDPKMVEINKLGQLNRIKPGGVAGGDMVASDPLGFLRTILLPAFKRKGITGERAILNEIATIFTNRTAASLYSLIYLQASKIDKNMAVNRGAMGVNQLMRAGDNTPMGVKLRSEAAWENMKTQLGLKVLPVVLPLIIGLADGVSRLAAAANRHPTLTKWLALTAIGLSAIATVVGGIALVAGGIMLVAAALGGGIAASTALAIAGITAAVIAFGAAVIAWWPQIKKTLSAVAEAVFGFFSYLWEKLKGGWKGFLKIQSAQAATGMDENGFALPAAKRPTPAAPGPWGSRPLAPAAGGANAQDLASAMKQALNGTVVKLDGKTVGHIVTQQQGAAANRPATGPSGFDGRLGTLQPSMAMNGAR